MAFYVYPTDSLKAITADPAKFKSGNRYEVDAETDTIQDDLGDTWYKVSAGVMCGMFELVHDELDPHLGIGVNSGDSDED